VWFIFAEHHAQDHIHVPFKDRVIDHSIETVIAFHYLVDLARDISSRLCIPVLLQDLEIALWHIILEHGIKIL